MAIAARRTPPSTRTPARTATKPASSGYRGAAGIAKMHEEEVNHAARKEAAQMNRDMPFRFFCPVGAEAREVVIIDYTMSEVFFRHEHNLRDKRTNKWSVFTACIGENAICPVCKEAERPAYFAMYLTVIDLTPYTNKDGDEVPWSKKLMVVKFGQQKKITRLADRHGGNLRGMVLAMSRDGEKDAAIGNDIEFVEFMSEDDLAAYETTIEYKDSAGKKQVKEIIGHEPFDYDALFPMPTEQQLRAIVGGRPEPGSREDDDATIGRRSSRPARGDDWESDAPAPTSRTAAKPTARASAPAARPAARPATRTRQAEIDHDDRPDVGVEEEEEEAPAPSRRAAPPQRTATAASQRKPAARRAAVEEDPEEEEEEEEAEEAPPPSRRAAPARTAPVRTARVARPDPEAEEEEAEEETEGAPSRGSAQSLAERRRQLRR